MNLLSNGFLQLFQYRWSEIHNSFPYTWMESSEPQTLNFFRLTNFVIYGIA